MLRLGNVPQIHPSFHTKTNILILLLNSYVHTDN